MQFLLATDAKRHYNIIMINIFCMDEDHNCRELMVYAVNNNGMKCRGFDNAADFRTEVSSDPPDLILLDINLSEADGMELLCGLKADRRIGDIPLIIVSEKREEYDKISALDAGADDYVEKPFSVLELLSRIRAVLRRSSGSRRGDICVGNIVMECSSHRVFAGDKEIPLTNREYQLLRYLMENEGILIRRDDLLYHVWGFDVRVETRTVDVHIRYLRQKLGESGRLIETVRGVGYRIREKS